MLFRSFDDYAFNMMNYYEFASDKYLSLLVEHHFDGFFFNRVPFFRKLKWREVVSAKSLIGRVSEKNLNAMRFPDGMRQLSKPYGEASIGIENIFFPFISPQDPSSCSPIIRPNTSLPTDPILHGYPLQ